MTGRTALYRHFAADGSLLYVGISLSALQRLRQHRASSDWYPEIATVTIEWHPTRDAALLAERQAISLEGPAMNRTRHHVNPSFAVLHPVSACLDGWYLKASHAAEALQYFREEYPLDDFQLVSIPSAHAWCLDADDALVAVGAYQWAESCGAVATEVARSRADRQRLREFSLLRPVTQRRKETT